MLQSGHLLLPIPMIGKKKRQSIWMISNVYEAVFSLPIHNPDSYIIALPSFAFLLHYAGFMIRNIWWLR